MHRSSVLGVALCVLASAGLPAAGQSSDCDLASWRACPDIMLIDPSAPASGVGAPQVISNQIIDMSDYETVQFVQTDVPAGISSPEWHAHEFDALIFPVAGKSRFWWLNRDTGERKSIVFDAARRAYLLVPEGVSHFVDQRAAETGASVVEYFMSKEKWTSEDFVAHRVHVDEPFPPVLPLQ